jgi:hypothetical protein
MPPCHGGGRGFESRPVRKKGGKAFIPFFNLLHTILNNPHKVSGCQQTFSLSLPSKQTKDHQQAPIGAMETMMITL